MCSEKQIRHYLRVVGWKWRTVSEDGGVGLFKGLDFRRKSRKSRAFPKWGCSHSGTNETFQNPSGPL